MTGEGLFKLVRSLSKQQKANFSRFVDAKKGSKPQYYTLFERLLLSRTYDESQIRGKEFSRASKYYQNREILADKLIQSMVYFNGNRGSVRAYVIRAIELNATEMARKRLIAGMEEALKRGDWSALDSLHRLLGELTDAYRLDIKLPDHLPDWQEVRSHIRSWDSLEELQQRVKYHLQTNFGDHLFHARVFRSKLDEIPVLGDKGAYLQAKVRVSLELLKQDYEQAVVLQNELVSVLEQGNVFFKNPTLIKEYSILIRLANQVKFDQLALQGTVKLGSIVPESPREEDLKQHYQTKALVTVATTQCNLDMALQGRDGLLQRRELFKEEEVPTYLFACAGVFFVHGAYREALHTLSEIRAGKRSLWEELNWGVDLLRLLSNFELGNVEVITSLRRSLMRSAQGTEKEYPSFASRLVGRVMDAIDLHQSQKVWQKNKQEYLSYCQNPLENMMTEIFDLSLWLDARATGRTVLKVHEERRHENGGEKRSAATGHQ